jgi:hypothetical protein
MKNPRIAFIAFAAALLSGCATTQTADSQTAPGDGTAPLFQDSMMDDWREQWFLDGEKATLEHRPEGLFFSGGTVTKREDPEEYHAHHAVLWTKQIFEGDLRITFEMTRVDESDYGNTLLYIYAQGLGIDAFEKDITQWSEFRAVPAMSKYFTNMDLLSLSFRHNLRARRYPLQSAIPGEEATGGTALPYVDYIGMIPGKTYLVEVETRGPDLTLRLFDKETEEPYVDYTWDMTQLEDGKEAPVLNKGRIGLRHMATKQFIYKDFTVEQL